LANATRTALRGPTFDQLFAQLAGAFNVTTLHASVDGRAVSSLWAHRETAPAFSYTFQLTDNLAELT
jgi:hypothetical protein